MAAAPVSRSGSVKYDFEGVSKMPFTKGSPPSPHAGDISPLTKALRPEIGLAADECKRARRLRRRGHEITEIAARLGTKEVQVQQALATMRTKMPEPSRRSLNVTLAAHQFVVQEAKPSEACWETVDRLFVELAFRRAFAAASRT